MFNLHRPPECMRLSSYSLDRDRHPTCSSLSLVLFDASTVTSGFPSRRFRSFPTLSVCTLPRRSKSVWIPQKLETASLVAFSATRTMTASSSYSVLFVCLGNICRSPAAEAVFRHLVKKKGLKSRFMIDSAGTIDFHEGNPADPRMIAAAKLRNIAITSISRPIRPRDFTDFDAIIAMDNNNRDDILKAYHDWQREPGLPSDADLKVKLMCSYCKRHGETEVPDPYYGGRQGFEKVLDILEDACESLLESIVASP